MNHPNLKGWVLFFIIFTLFITTTTSQQQTYSIVEFGTDQQESIFIVYPGQHIEITKIGDLDWEIDITPNLPNISPITLQRLSTELTYTFKIREEWYNPSYVEKARTTPVFGTKLEITLSHSTGEMIVPMYVIDPCIYMTHIQQITSPICTPGSSICHPKTPTMNAYCECTFPQQSTSPPLSISNTCSGSTNAIQLSTIRNTVASTLIYHEQSNRYIGISNAPESSISIAQFRIQFTTPITYSSATLELTKQNPLATTPIYLPFSSASPNEIRFLGPTINYSLQGHQYNAILTLLDSSSQILYSIHFPLTFYSDCAYIKQFEPTCLGTGRDGCNAYDLSCTAPPSVCGSQTLAISSTPILSSTTFLQVSITATAAIFTTPTFVFRKQNENWLEIHVSNPSQRAWTGTVQNYDITLDKPLPGGQWILIMYYPNALSNDQYFFYYGCEFTQTFTVTTASQCTPPPITLSAIEPLYEQSTRFAFRIDRESGSYALDYRYPPTITNDNGRTFPALPPTHWSPSILSDAYNSYVTIPILEGDEYNFVFYYFIYNGLISACSLPTLSVSVSSPSPPPIITTLEIIGISRTFTTYRISQLGQYRIESTKFSNSATNIEFDAIISQSYIPHVSEPFLVVVNIENPILGFYELLTIPAARQSSINLVEVFETCPTLTWTQLTPFITPTTTPIQFSFSNVIDNPSTSVSTSLSYKYNNQTQPITIYTYVSFPNENTLQLNLDPNRLPGRYDIKLTYRSQSDNSSCESEFSFDIVSHCDRITTDIGSISINWSTTSIVFQFTISDSLSYVFHPQSAYIQSISNSTIIQDVILLSQQSTTDPNVYQYEYTLDITTQQLPLDAYELKILGDIPDETPCLYTIGQFDFIQTFHNEIDIYGTIKVIPTTTLPNYTLPFITDRPNSIESFLNENQIQVPVGSIFTIDVNTNLPSDTKADVIVQYYPLIGDNQQYATKPIIISTTEINLPSSSTPITIPLSTHTTHNAVITITYIHPTTQITKTLTTLPFSILSSCYVQPTIISPSTTLTNWGTTCTNDNSICLPSGQCSTTTSIIEDNDECNECIKPHTSQCNEANGNQCECKSTFSGSNCEQSDNCKEQTKNQCGTNGYIEYDITSQQCKTNEQCQCYNYWIGNKCQQCNLQCLNNGKRYLNCDRCGCSKGYSGIECQCQSNIGIINLNGYSEIYNAFQLISTKEKDVKLKSTLYDELKDNADTLFKEIASIFQQLLQLDSIKSLQLKFNQIENSNYNPSSQTTTTTIEVPYYTTFTLTIQFNCEGYNKDLTTDELLQRWETLQTKLSSSSIIQKYFIFATNTPPTVTTSKLEPIEDSLPSPEDELKDQVNNINVFFDRYTLLVVMMMYIFLYQM